jgi:hypothetical protein
VSTRRCLYGAATFLGTLTVAWLCGAESPPAASIAVVAPSHPAVTLTLDELARLSTVQITVAFLTEHGVHQASFAGPLLWTVLQRAGAIDPAKPREEVSRSIVITGRDGYRAVLALAEIAPEFEGKQVLLAERMDDHDLGADHLRVVVPLDKRGGRSVRDVTRIEVTEPTPH